MKRPPPKGWDYFGSAGYGYDNVWPTKRKVHGLRNYPKIPRAATLVSVGHPLTEHLKRKGKV